MLTLVELNCVFAENESFCIPNLKSMELSVSPFTNTIFGIINFYMKIFSSTVKNKNLFSKKELEVNKI